jgi:hypothetical protein
VTGQAVHRRDLLYRWLVNPDIPVQQLHESLREHIDQALRAN